MPYIKNRWYRWNREDSNSQPKNVGELNYIITMVIKEYYDSIGGYQGVNDVLGALEGAKLEFYRRVASPYEDIKIKENGDVYD